MNKLKYLYVIVGKSGSGKDTVVGKLCNEYGFKSVTSYTTRPKRQGEGDTHIFVTKKEFNKIRKDLVAYTYFNGNEYGATKEQVNQADIYIIDKKGIEFFKEHYDRPFKIIYLDVPESICFQRMLHRGDDKAKAHERVENDKIEFQGVQEIADMIVDNQYIMSCVCDIREYISKCEVGD